MGITPGHHSLTDNQVERIRAIKDAEAGFLEVLDLQPQGREVSIARTKVQEAAMWAVRAVSAR